MTDADASQQPSSSTCRDPVPAGCPLTRRVRTFAELAHYAAKSAARLDRLEQIQRERDDDIGVIVDHERALLERRCLAILDAVRRMDEPAYRWAEESRA